LPAPAYGIIHVEPGLREIAFAFGDLDRTERRQDRRRREEICDFLLGARR
jgi:hypothetical protein